MSSETEAFRVLRASKHATIAMWALLWSSFRCHIDRVLVSGIANPLQSVPGPNPPVVDPAKLTAELHRCMTRSAPKGYKGTSENAKRYRRSEGVPLWTTWHRLLVCNEWFYLAKTGDKRGFGLFARKDVSFAKLQTVLFGWLCPISLDEYEQLHEAGHPSLFQRGTKRYILAGPISCVNHDCASCCGFAAPKTFPVDGFTTPSFVGDVAAGEWEPRLLVLRDLSGQSHKPCFRKGDEIVVRYQDEYPDCKCSQCAKPPKKRGKREAAEME